MKKKIPYITLNSSLSRKRIYIILIATITLISCSNDESTTSDDAVTSDDTAITNDDNTGNDNTTIDLNIDFTQVLGGSQNDLSL